MGICTKIGNSCCAALLVKCELANKRIGCCLSNACILICSSQPTSVNISLRTGRDTRRKQRCWRFSTECTLQVTVLISLDLSAAFDTVDHEAPASLVRVWRDRHTTILAPFLSGKSYAVCQAWTAPVTSRRTRCRRSSGVRAWSSAVRSLLQSGGRRHRESRCSVTPTTHSSVWPCLLTTHPTVCLYSLQVLLTSDNDTYKTGFSSTRTSRRH